MITFVFIFFSFFISSALTKAQETPVLPKSESLPDDSDDNIIRRPPDKPVSPIVFTEQKKRETCAKFNSKFISIYGEVFKVEKCERQPITDPDLIFRLQRKGVQLMEVSAQEIAPIPVGRPFEEKESPRRRNCQELNGKYITVSYSDIYFVDKCTRYLLPEFETFLEHRRKRKVSASSEILGISYEEFSNLKTGNDIPSIIDLEENSERPGKKSVDIIPITEACKGIEGKIVSFHSRLMRIEKCRRREIKDTEAYSKNFLKSSPKIIEISAEQWESLPEGKPL